MNNLKVIVIYNIFVFFRGFIENYNPGHWSANGPILITKVLQDICNTTITSEMTRENCRGFNIYDASHFYAISWQIYIDALSKDPEKVKKMFSIIENSTLIHMSNCFSANNVIQVDTPITYGILAEMNCPKVYHSLSYFF